MNSKFEDTDRDIFDNVMNCITASIIAGCPPTCISITKNYEKFFRAMSPFKNTDVKLSSRDHGSFYGIKIIKLVYHTDCIHLTWNKLD